MNFIWISESGNLQINTPCRDRMNSSIHRKIYFNTVNRKTSSASSALVCAWADTNIQNSTNISLYMLIMQLRRNSYWQSSHPQSLTGVIEIRSSIDPQASSGCAFVCLLFLAHLHPCQTSPQGWAWQFPNTESVCLGSDMSALHHQTVTVATARQCPSVGLSVTQRYSQETRSNMHDPQRMMFFFEK